MSWNLVDGAADELHDMELVEGDLGLRQVLGDALDAGAAHIDADFLDPGGIGVGGVDVIGERGNGVGIFAIRDVDDAPRIDVVAEHASSMTNSEI